MEPLSQGAMNILETIMIVIMQASLLTCFSLSSCILFQRSYAEVTKCIDYNIYANTITVRCNASLSQIYQAVNDNTILERDPHGVWILNAIINVSRDAKLTINRTDTSWLKITNKILQESEPNYISVSGLANINGVKITSWDPFSNDTIRQNTNGSIPRPYFTVNEGTANISDSEIAFLGFNLNPPESGLSYVHTVNGSRITTNNIHDMWDGFHSESTRSITISGNKYFNNLRSGIYLSQSSNTRVLGNVLGSTRIAIQIAQDSSNNHIYNNTITDNNFGFYFADKNPKDNLFENNYLNNVYYPIKLDGKNNIGKNNTIYNNNS